MVFYGFSGFFVFGWGVLVFFCIGVLGMGRRVSVFRGAFFRFVVGFAYSSGFEGSILGIFGSSLCIFRLGCEFLVCVYVWALGAVLEGFLMFIFYFDFGLGFGRVFGSSEGRVVRRLFVFGLE